ncbi:MAG: HNH endonuclease [Candidatus Scalindua sp.]|nr:HNH endonuclease [Candidatus Scalindua sp.]MBT6757795.1 HNH endonuclease [Candidatus Jacksonbacteria bacterium]
MFTFTCQGCGKRGGDLQADHIKPFAYFKDLRFEISNGQTMCKPCHYETPTFGEKAKKYEYSTV